MKLQLRVQFFLKSLAVTVFFGCQLKLVKQNEARCGNENIRQPNSLACASLFKAKATNEIINPPSEQAVKHFFDELASYELDQNRILEFLEKMYHFRIATRSGHCSQSEILAQRALAGDMTAEILSQVGFRLEKNQMQPPKNLAKIFFIFYEKLFEAAQQQGVQISDVVLPSFGFKKAEQLIWVRPGIDPLPPKNEGWVVYETERDISEAVYREQIIQKKLPMTPDALFHDVGHIVDLIEHPNYGPALGKIIQAKINASEKARSFFKTHDDMEFYLNEFLYLPSEKNRERIDQILQFGANLFAPEALQKARQMIENKEILFSRHGGGARDTSHERGESHDLVLAGLNEVILGESFYRYYNTRDQSAYHRHEAPGFFDRLQLFIDVLEKKEIPIQIKMRLERLAQQKNKSVEAVTEELLMKQLEQIQSRIRVAQKFKITPEQLAADLALLYDEKNWPRYLHSPTYQFYLTYPQGSFQRFNLTHIP